MPSCHDVRRESGMSLVREEAAEWLAAKNYCVAVTSSNLRVVGDWVVIDEFSLGRFYHNAPSLIRHSSGSGVALLIVVDGGVHVTRGAESWDLDKGDALAMPRDCRVELRSVGPYGVVEVELGERFTGRYAVENGTVPTRISAETGTLRLLVSASSLTLTIASSIDCSEWQHLRDVIEAAAGGALRCADYGSEVAGPYAALLRRARETIGRRAAEADFSVTALATALAVSPALLHRAFAAIGSTPLTEIRRERVAAARRMLDRRRSPSPVELERVAALSGFRSLRALRTASRAIDLNRSD